MKRCLSCHVPLRGSFDGLLQLCRRRALADLELVLEEHGHGLDPMLSMVEELWRACQEQHLRICWIRLPDLVSPRGVFTWAARAHMMGVGLLVPQEAAAFILALKAALVHPTNVHSTREAAALAQHYDLHTCWEVDPGAGDPDTANQVLEITSPTLAHVRLLGADPEAEVSGSPEGAQLISGLAKRGYNGTVALVASSSGGGVSWQQSCHQESRVNKPKRGEPCHSS